VRCYLRVLIDFAHYYPVHILALTDVEWFPGFRSYLGLAKHGAKSSTIILICSIETKPTVDISSQGGEPLAST